MRRLQKNESAIIDWKCCIKLSAGIFMEHHHKRLTAVLTGSFCHGALVTTQFLCNADNKGKDDEGEFN